MEPNFTKVTVVIANEIANMMHNNFVQECGGEPFEGWCEDGGIFYDYIEEYALDKKEVIALMKKVAPHVDAITNILNENEKEAYEQQQKREAIEKALWGIVDVDEAEEMLRGYGKVSVVDDYIYDGIINPDGEDIHLLKRCMEVEIEPKCTISVDLYYANTTRKIRDYDICIN